MFATILRDLHGKWLLMTLIVEYNILNSRDRYHSNY